MDPISYQADGGYYQVGYRLQGAEAPFVYDNANQTADKSASSLTLTGLMAGSTYDLVVSTFTPAHGLNAQSLLALRVRPLRSLPLFQTF